MIRGLKEYTRVFKRVKLPWLLLALVVVLSVVKTNVEVESISLTASIIDGTQNTVKVDELVRYVVYLVLSGVLTIASTYVSGLTYQKINLGVRLKLWKKMMNLPTRFYDSDDGNELVSRVTTDADSAYCYFQLVISLFTAVYGCITAYRKLFRFQPTLAAVELVIIPLTIGITLVYGMLMYRAGATSRNRLAATMGYLVERVRNLRLIKSFRMEKDESDTADQLFQKQCRANINLSLSGIVQLAGMEIIGCISIVVSFLFGGQMVAAGTLTTGKLVGFYTLAGLAAVRMAEICSYSGTFAQYAGIMQKIARVLELPDEPEEGMELAGKSADLTLDHVSFSYGTVPILKDVCCTIPRGKVTAIIGTNGAGKTTLFKLLERMYAPSEGMIRFGETDIAEFSLPAWRGSLAIVAQDKPLLSGTIRENILYGVRRDVSEAELIDVAKKANVYDFAMAAGGFDAQVGPGGANFSGGQQQCIAIARAMMRDPSCLLLDEATSNLDVKSEQQVTLALKHLMEGRTTVLIAHNYSAALFADQVIVMRDGEVEASGTPSQLLETNDYYRSFAKGTAESRSGG